jgi:hypothetical protein
MNKQPRQYEDDDGRTICDMDVAGLRWHDRRFRREKRAEARAAASAGQLTRSEARRYTWYAMLAGLMIVSVFSATWILFTLFCTEIWFK